jgi:autotransporter-associated beta strand protein
MRLAPLGLLLSLAALPLVTQAQITRLSQSSVTLSSTFLRTGEPTTATRNGRTTTTTRFDTASFGNAALLEVMLANDLLPQSETTIKGWSLVAVWADWESTGASSYRFFARKKISGVINTIAVPPSLLRLELLDPYVRKNVNLREGKPISGSVLYKALAQVSLGADTFYLDPTPTEPDDNIRQTDAASTQGVIVGPGRYVRPADSDSAIYLPGSTSFRGFGVSRPGDDEQDNVVDIVDVRLRLGAATSVPATQYANFIDVAGGKNSRDPDITAVDVTGSLSGTGATIITGSGSLTLSVSGPVSLSGSNSHAGSITVTGGTLTLSPPISFNTAPASSSGNLEVSNLAKLGSGIVTLSGSNSYSGSVTLNDGTLAAPSGSPGTIITLYQGQ